MKRKLTGTAFVLLGLVCLMGASTISSNVNNPVPNPGGVKATIAASGTCTLDPGVNVNSISFLPESGGTRSAFYHILPWLEHGNFWADVEAKRRRFNDDYEMTIYLSPADPTLDTPDAKKGTASYCYNAQIFVSREVKLPNRTITSRNNPTLNEKFIPDGLSNTIMVAEHYALGCGHAQFSWALAEPTVRSKLTPAYMRRASFADVDDVVPSATQSPTVAFQVRPKLADCDPRVPQTPYPSGMLVGLADGSVRLMSPNISPGTFWAAVTPAGGETLGSDW
jgi:hypothetical protein